MPYEVIVQKQVEEEYTSVEPYTVLEGVQEPYTVQEKVREPYTDYSRRENERAYALPNPGVTKWRTVTKDVTKYRTVTKEVTEYREVTKTRLVTRPVVETRTKRVSVLRYLLR